MAFNVTFRNICDKDIRHIYSGPAVPVRQREHKSRSSSPCKEAKARRTWNDGFWEQRKEYWPEYDCFLPRAAGFQLCSKEQVRSIVDRLHRQPRTQEKGASRSCKNDDADQGPNPKLMGRRNVSREELHDITERLNKPTKMSISRERRPLHLAIMTDVDSAA